jgi:hypothetical protein
MNPVKLALVITAFTFAACQDSAKRTEDSTEDTTDDTVVEDSSTDAPDVPPDVVDDSVDDPITEVLDTPEDPVEDTPIDTIGSPCETDEDCDMGTWCDGDEYCHPAGDCRRAPPPDCSDDDPCTTDSCNEETDSCDNILIDGDGDTYPPESCGGPDCDDTDSTIHPGATDTCGDGIDQDCDGMDASDGSCSCPAIITLPSTIRDDTTGYSSLYEGTCATGSGAPEIVYQLTLTSDTDVVFDLSAPGWEGIVYINAGTCDGTEVDCLRDTDPPTLLSLTTGTYYIFVDGRFGGEEGGFTLDVAVPPPNDDCADAIVITADGTYTGNNTAATDTADPATCAGGSTWRNGHDVWYTFTLTADTTLTLEADSADFDAVLYVLQGSCTGTEVACDDDSGPGSDAEITQSFSADTYYVVVDDFYNTTGDYSFTITGL